MEKVIENCQDINELKILIGTGIWKNNPELKDLIIQRFQDLAPVEDELPTFDEEQFNEEDYDPNQEPWILESVYQQHGGAAIGNQTPTPNDDLYQIVPISHQDSPRYYINRSRFNVQFNDKVEDFDSQAPQIWESVMKKAIGNDPGPEDKIGITIDHPSLDIPVLIKMTKYSCLNGNMISNEIANVQQSKRQLEYGSSMDVTLSHARAPQGSGIKRDCRDSIIQYNQCHPKNRNIIKIRNQDHSCCARAIIVGKAKVDKDKQYDSIIRGDQQRYKIQQNLAFKLMEDAGVNSENPSGIPEIRKYQHVLGEWYQIKVWGNMGQLLFQGLPATKVIHIHYNELDKHYDTIASITGFLGRSYFCEHCNKGYQNIDDHCCSTTCPDCHSKPPCHLENLIHCQDCNRNFRSAQCLVNHKRENSNNNGTKSSLCQRLKLCLECGTLIKGKKNVETHKCYAITCPDCHEYTEDIKTHQCYMKKPQTLDKDIEPTFIVFDLETHQNTPLDKETPLGKQYLHIPNLCIAYKFCNGCMEQVLEKQIFDKCPKCQINRKTFDGPDTMKKFGDWLFTENQGSKQNPVVALAHNSKGYDSSFILNYLHEHGYSFDYISKGTEIMVLTVNGITIKDSLNYLPMKLAKIPSTFGFKEMKKGYFPHYFNTPENEDYDGPLPDHHYYGTSSMTPEARCEFFFWYSQLVQSNYKFNLKKERWAYCNNDVFICSKGIMKFRELVFKHTDVDPLLEACTIASSTNIVYRKNFLKPKTIALIPNGGYRKQEHQSQIAMKWLKWISHKKQIRIQHAKNGGEVTVKANGKDYKVDGYAEIDGKKTVFEFNGCYFHGCRRCYKRCRSRKIKKSNKSLEDAFQQTINKKKAFISAGYEVEDLWGCQLDVQLEQDPEMLDFFNNIVFVDPLVPRKALFGGRTNATKLLHVFRNGEEGRYVDFCSLYPTTLMYDAFPLGHPLVITENFYPINKTSHPYKGLIKCHVLPPRKLYHPVLPVKLDKTIFPLCYTCAEEKNQQPCTHSDQERILSGTWTHFELYKAVELGYEVVEIDEVYHWEDWAQFDGKDPDSGLFSRYVMTWLKIKQEASGWPSWVKTEQDREQYINDYEAKMGIQLNPNNIKKNPGLRALAKLFLNSFWGKLAQRPNLPIQKYVTPEEWFKMYYDETLDIHSFYMVGKGDTERMVVRFADKREFEKIQPNTNVVLASFVTSHARLRLYSLLEQLQERVLYFDTDSVFYISRPGDQDLPVGDYLGDLTDELTEYGEGSYITEFCSAGPKNYMYRVFSTKDQKIHTTIKVKGFPLDYTTMKHINASNMKNKVRAFVKSGNQEETSVINWRIRRLPDYRIVTRLERKKYRVVYDKRVARRNYYTHPYGY